MPRQYEYSQHFLKDPSLTKELLGHTSLKPSDTVIDIGAGSGVITSVLVQRFSRVIAVEVEPKALALLEKNLLGAPGLAIYHGSFLRMPLPTRDYTIFSNIPFHLSSPIIRRLVEADSRPRLAYFILQRQFAQKLVADAKSFTAQLGMLVGARYEVRIRKTLQRTDFTPPPAVDTVFIELRRRDTPLIPAAQWAAYTAFTEESFSLQKKFSYTLRRLSSAPLHQRPSEYTIEEWVQLFEKVRALPAESRTTTKGSRGRAANGQAQTAAQRKSPQHRQRMSQRTPQAGQGTRGRTGQTGRSQPRHPR